MVILLLTHVSCL